MPEEVESSAVPVRVRIAPSPTGDPHVGTAYIGLINFIYARQRGGQFVLRIEDTDRARFVATSEQMIFDALRWVGLTWDEGPDVGGPYGPYRQSERTALYREHADMLLLNGAAYRCFCTPEELEASRKQQMAAKLPPRYAGTCRALAPEIIAANLAESKDYVVRMKVPLEGSTTFRDELRGEITFENGNVDDQVLMKSDGYPTYHLANVVDDHLMRITDVIRAEEWISSTPKHVLLYQAFGWSAPRFWHMPLLRNLDKSKISKRKNPVSLVYYRQAGFLPEAMLNFLGLMGGGVAAAEHSSDDRSAATGHSEQSAQRGVTNTPHGGNDAKPQKPAGDVKKADIFTLADMLSRFDIRNISLGGPVFDLTKLKWLNGEYLRSIPLDDFYLRLRSTILSDEYLRQIAALVQTRIETLGQFGDLTHFFFADDVLPTEAVFLPKKRTREETLAFAADQLSILEAAEWSITGLEAELKAFGEEKGWSVKENFMLLRAIITGSTMSPPLLESLIVFGKPRTLDRHRRFLEAQKKLGADRR